MPLMRYSGDSGLSRMCRFCARFPWETPPHTCGFPLTMTTAEFALLDAEVLESEREHWLRSPPQGAD